MFRARYAHRQETDCIKPRLVLAWMCWLRLCGCRTRAERTLWMQVFDWQGRETLPVLTMGITMPETWWV